MAMTYLTNWFVSLGLSTGVSDNLALLTLLGIIILLALIIGLITKHIIFKIFHSIVKLTAHDWGDAIMENGVYGSVNLIIPAVVIFYFVSLLFPAGSSDMIHFIQSICLMYIIVICVVILNAILNSVVQIYNSFDVSTHTPIKGFIQMIKIIAVIVAMIVIISMIMQKSPWTLLKALGALTAVLILVFKDSILGLVAGVQLSAQRMVRKGDWITMPKFDADGDVIDISLTTVKVQNFDKTIVNVPTYALVSNSFQNWRGMTESGGRRIKRSINLDMNSFNFLDRNDIERLKKFAFLEEYLSKKTEELDSFNKKLGPKAKDCAINGRKLTNIGTFRFYVKQYLKHDDRIRNDMTFMVRQLQPTEKGLPLQIYVFSNDTKWVNYEEIQADLFDHLLTAVPEFGLSVYQDPTGRDFRTVCSKTA